MLRFHASDDWVPATRFFPDGERLAGASGPESNWSQLSIWDLKTGTRLKRHEISRKAVALSQDQALVAIQDWDGSLTIRDTYSFDRRFATIRIHRRILAAEFQPGSPLLHTLVH